MIEILCVKNRRRVTSIEDSINATIQVFEEYETKKAKKDRLQ